MRNTLASTMAKINSSKSNLEQTRHATNLYFALVNRGYPTLDAMEIVKGFAEMEWGENTCCVFKNNEVVVENLDGRIEVIGGEQ